MKNQGDIFEFFMTKSFINFFFITHEDISKSSNKEKVNLFGYHFILEYIRGNEDLSETQTNKDLFNKIFGAKESEKKIGDYDFYM